MKKQRLLKLAAITALSSGCISLAKADIASCMSQYSYTFSIRDVHTWRYSCAQPPQNLDINALGFSTYSVECAPHLYACAQQEIDSLKIAMQSLDGKANSTNTTLSNAVSNINAQIQATNNSIATTVTNTVNQQLPAQVTQNLPQVVQSQLTPELIAKGLQSQYQMALSTKFKKNSGALYIRGFMTKVNENGGQELQVYAVDPDTNFCNSTDGFKSPAQATLYMGQKNATTIAAYLFSAYATGKPVVLETQGIVGTDGILQCHITNIKQDVDINTLKA
ncbi:hypothetical protein [Cysteiniphilum litorale]|uniref:hypothetical protein n=1 Tax=Cysteiniphilum litorale TaxID=2056700 RepID=UPI003F8854EE